MIGIQYGSAQSHHGQFKRWQLEDGLPQNSVKYILQTKQGYLWLATQGGLARFDGVRFQVFDVDAEPELKSNRMLTLFEDRKGRLFIGTSGGGLIVYENYRFKNISESLGVSGQMIHKVFADSKKRIWVVTEKSGVLVLDEENLQPLKQFDELRAQSPQNIFEINSGEVVMEHGIHTQVWKNNSLLDARGFYYNELPSEATASYYDEATNIIWISSFTTLYKIRDHQLLKQYPIPGYLAKGEFVLGIFQTSLDQLCISFNNSDHLVSFDINKEQFSADNLKLDCTHPRIEHVLKDNENNIWYGTSSCGLIKENRFNWEYVDTDPLITNHNIYPILKDNDGRILIGTNASGLYVIENGKSVDPAVKKAVPSYSFPYGLVETDTEEYYISCSGYEYLIKSKGSAVSLIKNSKAGNRALHSIYKSNSGEVWVGAGNGLFKLHNDSLIAHPASDRLNDEPVTSFFEDSKDNVWFLSVNFLFKYNKNTNTLKKYTAGTDFNAKFFRGANEDSNGRLYFGSYGYGLTIYDNEHFYEITIADGLVENVVSTITDDNKGNVWLTGNKGLSKLRKENLDDFLSHKESKLNVVLFDRADGFRNAEFNGAVQQSKCKIADGVYLFPTIDGCVKIDFNSIPYNEVAPPVIIESVQTEDSTYLPIGERKLMYSEGRTEFEFTALSFSSVKNIRFKYKLIGYDDEWKEAGTERKTSYTNIPPGTYTFRVIACNSDGVWNMTGASASLEIVPRYYMTWWFRTLIVVMTAFALSAIVILIDRNRKKKKDEIVKQQQKQELKSIVDAEERERKRIATDLHDGVGQLLTNVKINIGMLSEKKEIFSNHEQQLLDHSAKSLQEITQELRNISYNLLPASLDQFGLVSAMEEEIKNVSSDRILKIQFICNIVQTRFRKEVELAFYRMFQEIVNNVIKHSEASELSIQLIQHENSLQLIAEDDGKGFIVETGFGKKNSNGLKNLRSRISLLNGTISIDSMPGRGTTIIIEIPLIEKE